MEPAGLDAEQQDTAKLPTELLYHIIRLAASTDAKFAHACAYVSKLVCRWTAPDRWRTVIVTDPRKLFKLWHLLELTTQPSPHRGFTSLPGCQPGALVGNLFIDTSAYSPMRSEGVIPSTGRECFCFRVSCPHLDAHNKLVYGAQHPFHIVEDILRHFQHVNYLALGPEQVELRLDTVSPVKALITVQNEDKLAWLMQGLHFRHKRFSLDPDALPHADDVLWRADGSGVWKPSMESFSRRLKSVHFVALDPENPLSGVPMPVDRIEALRSGSSANLGRIADHQSGGPPPRLSQHDQQEAVKSRWYIWPAGDDKGKRRYPRGSDPLDSSSTVSQSQSNPSPQTNGRGRGLELHPFDNSYSRISPGFWSEFQQGVTKIRYDTRKFAFCPCEITASRLRPFMQEITTTGIDPSAKTEGGASTSTSTSTTASFRHSGPRHAAPPRGAGHFSFPNRDVQCGKSGMTAKQAALSTFGCSKFETLHLCWDPVPGTEDSEESDRSGSEQSSTSSSGVGGDSGWPVERQDIWTNTSSQNNEAQAPPPHTAQARASAWSSAAKSALEPFGTATDSRRSWVIPSSIESKQSKVIRADLIDSIRTTIGWTRQDQQLLSDTPWLRRGSDLAERMGGEERLSRLESIVSEIAYQHTSAESSTSPGSDEKLTIRMVPATERLKLGGMYVPYTEKQRLQWFLDNLDTDDA